MRARLSPASIRKLTPSSAVTVSYFGAKEERTMPGSPGARTRRENSLRSAWTSTAGFMPGECPTGEGTPQPLEGGCGGESVVHEALAELRGDRPDIGPVDDDRLVYVQPCRVLVLPQVFHVEDGLRKFDI